MPDWALALIVIALISVPLLWARLWWWAGLLGVIAGYEGIATWMSGRSLSQQFWAFHLAHPIAGWSILALFAGAWGVLLFHLAWRQLKRKAR